VLRKMSYSASVGTKIETEAKQQGDRDREKASRGHAIHSILLILHWHGSLFTFMEGGRNKSEQHWLTAALRHRHRSSASGPSQDVATRRRAHMCRGQRLQKRVD